MPKVSGSFAGVEASVTESDVNLVGKLVNDILRFYQRREISQAKKFMTVGHKSVGKDTLMRRLRQLPVDAYQPATSEPGNPVDFEFFVDFVDDDSITLKATNYQNLPGEALDTWADAFEKIQPEGLIFIIDEPRDMVIDHDEHGRLIYVSGTDESLVGSRYEVLETRDERIAATRAALEFTLELIGTPTLTGGLFSRFRPERSSLETHMQCVMVLVNRWTLREDWPEKDHQREEFLLPYRDLLEKFEEINTQYPDVMCLTRRLNLYEDDDRELGLVMLDFALGILGKTQRDLR